MRALAPRVHALAASLLVVCWGGLARADGSDGEGAIYGGAISAALVAAYAIELGIPDVRLELGPSDHRWALSFPLVVHGGSVELGHRWALGFAHFAEVQYQPARGARRIALGERLILFDHQIVGQFAPVIELGGLAGEDGSGGFVGAGLVVGDPDLGVTVGLVGRVVVTDAERRGDLVIDLQLPFGLDL